MIDLLSNMYPWTKVLHLLAVISWMAGLLYLPRLFVNHVEQGMRTEGMDAVFQNMERKLLKLIMNPAMIATWIFGLLLAMTPGIVDWGAIWPWVKLAMILGMTWFHMWLGKRRKEFATGTNTRSGRTYRIMNEVPTLMMVVIVISVVVKPF